MRWDGMAWHGMALDQFGSARRQERRECKVREHELHARTHARTLTRMKNEAGRTGHDRAAEAAIEHKYPHPHPYPHHDTREDPCART